MSAGLTGASALLSGVSQYEAGQQRSSLYRTNAIIAGEQAQSELQAGSANEEQQRLRGQAMTGQQVNTIGANNLQQRGTPSQVVSSTAALNEMNALTIRNNAARKAWGFRVQQVSDQRQSDLAASAGDFNAAGSILGGGAKAYGEADRAGGWF